MHALTIDGRSFRSIGLTSPEQRAFAHLQVAACGLHGFEPLPGETKGAYAIRTYIQAVCSGTPLYTFLGSILLPIDIADDAWSPELARETGEFLASRTAKPDILRLQKFLIVALNTFAEKTYDLCAAITAAAGLPDSLWTN